ncbi:MAG: putative lipid II flippase FtsW [Pseudomonadota bacterium]|nr:putative lipid II flippase FtsW [Pseudomonadota bacterium]
MSRNQQTFSHQIIIASIILTLIGIVEIYAASSTRAMEQYGNPYLYLVKHAAVCLFAIMLVMLIQHLPIAYLDRAPLILMGVALVLLSLLMIPTLAVKVGGAARWLQVMGLRFQPAELAKLALVFFIAKNISRHACNLEKFAHVFQNVFPIALVCGLIMLQPDFGATVMLFTTCFLMLYVAGLNSRYLIFFLGNAVLFVAVAIIFSPYRFKRLTIFLDPWSQLQAGGFQIVQSYLAFQNGGLFGTGLGESKQKLFFLPEAHTDFIMSVIGEELGLLGVFFVWGLFFYISYLGFRVVSLTDNRFHRYLAFGITTLITCQALFNMGVVTGLLPTKGLPLPFVSSGSSSLLVFFIAAGVLARLAKECQNGKRQTGQA